MKKLLVIMCALLGATTVNAQSGLGLMGGVNTSTSTADDVKWRFGGFIGGLYDIQFNDWFYLQPRLVFSYQENQREVRNTLATPSVRIGDEFYSQWSLTLPVLASFRFRLSDDLGLRVNVGPYIQCPLFGQQQTVVMSNQVTSQDGVVGYEVPCAVNDRERWKDDLGDRVTYGLQTGLQFDYKRWFATLDYKRSFHHIRLNMNGYENTLQLGVGYKF